jgi:hypothetical protein
MEPEILLPHSEELSAGPHLEPHESNPYHPNLFLKNISLYYLPIYVTSWTTEGSEFESR